MLILSALQGGVGVGVPLATDQVATAVTTVLTGASYTAPANSAKVGQVFYLRNEFAFLHAAATTPSLACSLVIGAAVLSFSLPQLAVATTFKGFLEALVTVRTIGAAGTARAQLRLRAMNITLANAEGGLDNDGSVTWDTTASKQLALTMNMATAVASNTLTIGQGIVLRLFG